MAPSAALAALLSLAAIVLCTAACVPSEPHVDCNFYGLSSPKWAELASQAEQLTAAWKSFVSSTPEYPAGQFSGQGLVITATKLDMVNIPTILEALQAEGFDLPVEVSSLLPKGAPYTMAIHPAFANLKRLSVS